MSQISISHTPAEGTIITGTAKGDQSTVILKNHRARWSRYLESWYIPRSRDNRPNTPKITALTNDLKAAGYTVTLHIDTTETRSIAEIEAEKIGRQNDRINALEQKVQRKEKALATAEAQHQATLEKLPPMGEPVKIGHHSEKTHRNALYRAHRATEKTISARSDLETAKQQLAAAKTTTAARYSPSSVYNKVKKLTAEKAKLERSIKATESNTHRAHLKTLLEDTEKQLVFWSEVQKEQSKDKPTFSKSNIAAGDFIKYENRWYKVARANLKTVTVWFDYERKVTSSYRIAYELITDHKQN
ncbi:DUF3560 domain-containing protein [Rothia nasimurium]|uniref:DUF3560 domain-containing protein n=1 Tax=Rothia nasimurium TaxID=85336 RepID=UPI003BA219A6